MLLLQALEVVALDPDRGELSEAGVDAVDRLARVEDRLHGRRAGFDARRGQAGSSAAADAEIDAPPIGERQPPRLQDHHAPLLTRRHSGLKPMR